MIVTLAELARALDARLWGDPAIRVKGAAEPSQVEPLVGGSGRIALAMDPKYAQGLRPGSVAVLAEGMEPEAYGLAAAVLVQRPRLAMAGLTRAFDPGPDIQPGIHPTAIVDPDAQIGAEAAVGPVVVIGAGTRIGARARIGSHSSIGRNTIIGADALIGQGVRVAHGVVIGDRLIVHAGAVIGSDGFSFVTPGESGVEEIRRTLGQRRDVSAQSWVRIHSLGGVEIGDDVEIGANSTIDRGTVRATQVGSGTKIDNLVTVGHNARIGRDCLFAGQVGIAGSTRVGDRVVLGGKVGASDNIFIGDDVIAGGGTNIYTSVPAGRVILGSPATKMDAQIEIQKAIRRLPRLSEQVAELRRAVTRLSEKD